MKISSSRGLSLIELVIFIVIMGLAVPPLFIVAANIFEEHMNMEAMHVSTNLAQSKVEELKSKGFDAVVNEGKTDFPGQFSSYEYQVTVNYVDGSDLDTPVDPVTTNFKLVTVSVRNKGFLGTSVTFKTIIAND